MAVKEKIQSIYRNFKEAYLDFAEKVYSNGPAPGIIL
jgi:hypothetical protein